MVRAASATADFPPTTPPGCPILLASRSPRRRLLLEQAGIPYIAEAPGIDDGALHRGGGTPAAWVAALAYLKAAWARSRWPLHPGPILGADTVCLLDGRVIGQARDEADAVGMLRAFEGRAHQVLTGVAIVVGDRRDLFVDAAGVRVGPLGGHSIDEYVSSGAWRGKAGAYNLEDRLAAGWPIEFDGDPTTVMGLPMRRLIPLLGRLGVTAPPAGGRAA